MTRLFMLVEGSSEKTFVEHTLTPHLAQHGVYAERPIVLWTKRLPEGGGSRGGVSNWSQIKRNLHNLMRDSDAWISTMLDFYGLPEDFPGREGALKTGNPHEKVEELEKRFAAEFNNHRRFIPFFALHEFEAWLFSAPDIAEAHFDSPGLANKLRNAVKKAGEPELINHGITTHPKALLKKMVEGYVESSDGPTLLENIGLQKVRAECPHFNNWLKRLETLGEKSH